MSPKAGRMSRAGSSPVNCRYNHGLMNGLAYSSDLTDAEWNAIGPLLGAAAIDRPARPDLRYVINGILFLLRCGAVIRTAPPWSSAEGYYAQWRADGKWERILAVLLTTRPARAVG